MDLIIGVDIGLSGAICFLDTYASTLLSIYDMPIMDGSLTKSGRKKSILDIGRLHFIFEIPKFHFDSAVVVIESIHSFPGQGVVSVGTLLEQKGIIRGLAFALGYELAEVSPKTWQKHCGIVPPKDLKGQGPRKKWLKEKSRTIASETYPEFSEKFLKNNAHGRSDSCLIAKYYRDIYVPPSTVYK